MNCERARPHRHAVLSGCTRNGSFGRTDRYEADSVLIASLSRCGFRHECRPVSTEHLGRLPQSGDLYLLFHRYGLQRAFQ
jgi:hypothetical protein